MTEPAILINGLEVRVGQRCLLDISQLHVEHGERIALVGPNGAGKSTLLRVLGGFVHATAGSITVLGRSFGPHDRPNLTRAQWRGLRRQVGQVMQGLHLVPRLTARENVILGALARPGAMSLWRSWLRLYPSDLHHEADRALLESGLGDRGDTRSDRLSGGERQKVSIARLKLQRPKLILADEPTSALDPSATLEACRSLRSISEEATMVSVVHSAELMPVLADRVIGLSQGRVIFDLPIEEATPERLSSLYSQTSASTVCEQPIEIARSHRSFIDWHLGPAVRDA
jgi:phosphonate transport system ATP-binding protein